jgi:carbonic anhydrase/acetyltransferase-like protein (isoleucine patch superfamily)
MPLYALDGTGPTVPADSEFWVAPTATLIGDVRLGRDVGIWFGAVLRADNDSITVGAGSNVQDNCVIHADPGFPVVVGDFCTIGHNATIHGCTIGENSLIGMGATILNGAHIGRNCLIAANALVVEKAIIPDNSLVRGIPAKVFGTLDEERIRLLRQSAEDYIAAWKRFRTGLALL